MRETLITDPIVMPYSAWHCTWLGTWYEIGYEKKRIKWNLDTIAREMQISLPTLNQLFRALKVLVPY